jgi:MFS family permease
LLSQLPGGELLDTIRSKRFLIALGGIMVAVSALAIALRPTRPVVVAALVVQGLTGGLLGPAIAAVTLGLVGHSTLAERLGRNQRFSSAGALTATAAMGMIGYFLSYRAIFFTSTALALPLLAALSRIRLTEIHFGRACGQPDHHAPTPPPRTRRLALWRNYGLLVFAGCLFLFQFANASMLPLVGEELAYRNGTSASLLVSALLIVTANRRGIDRTAFRARCSKLGRRPLLLLDHRFRNSNHIRPPYRA